MSEEQSKGTCHLCGGTFGKEAMTAHLESCLLGESAGAPVGGQGSQKAQKARLLHLVAEGSELPEYWMHLEAPATAKLEDLDDFLRRTWLECCGHGSAFSIAGKTYAPAPFRQTGDRSMAVALGDVLRPGMEFSHQYDFGTTTELVLGVVAEREGAMRGKSVRLLARNDPPAIACVSCGKPATHVCTECLYSDEGWLCDDCAAEHECGEEMLLPVVNSPRVGMCGYTGE